MTIRVCTRCQVFQRRHLQSGNDFRLQLPGKMAAPLLSSPGTRGSRAVGACPAQAKEDEGPMTGTLTAPVEALLREQVAKGHFPSLDRALEAARWMRLRWVDQYLFRRLLRLHKLTRKLFIIF
jgi:hypothetical protein